MRHMVEGLISRLKADPSYRLEPELTNRELLTVLEERGVQAIRGMRWRLAVGSCEGMLFCGSGVKIRHGYHLSIGRSVILEDNVRIDALSTQGVRLGSNVTIRRGTALIATGVLRSKGVGIRIGEGSSVGDMSYLGGQGGIDIGRNVLLGPNVLVFSEDHRYESPGLPIKHQGERRARVVIEDNCWIGAGTVILKGTRVGAGAVVGARSVVTRDIPSSAVAVGAPARVVKERAPVRETEA